MLEGRFRDRVPTCRRGKVSLTRSEFPAGAAFRYQVLVSVTRIRYTCTTRRNCPRNPIGLVPVLCLK
jgi:hypothetical protein